MTSCLCIYRASCSYYIIKIVIDLVHALIVNYAAVVEKLRAQQSKPASSSEVSLKTKTSSKTGEKVNIQS